MRSCVLIWTTSTIFSTIRCEARSCEITLIHAASESCRRSALLCVVNVGLLDHFLRFFIREFLTHIFHHVTLILCKIWGGRLNSLSDGMDNFLLCNLNRASVSVSHRLVNITVAQLLRRGSTRQTTRCSRSCNSSHVCRAVFSIAAVFNCSIVAL